MRCNNGWVSWISYNSKEYLKTKLDELVEGMKIDFYYFIWHKGEKKKNSEEREKDHIHLKIHANGRFDSMEFQKYTMQIDPKHKIPRQCILPIKEHYENKEIFDGAILYDKHDEEYLKSIGETREFHYKWEEFITSNELQFQYYADNAEIPKNPIKQIEEAIDKDESNAKLIKKGIFKYRDIVYVQKLREEIWADKQRSRRGFKDCICIECGEIKSPNEIVPESINVREDNTLNTGICYKCAFEKIKKE